MRSQHAVGQPPPGTGAGRRQTCMHSLPERSGRHRPKDGKSALTMVRRRLVSSAVLDLSREDERWRGPCLLETTVCRQARMLPIGWPSSTGSSLSPSGTSLLHTRGAAYGCGSTPFRIASCISGYRGRKNAELIVYFSAVVAVHECAVPLTGIAQTVVCASNRRSARLWLSTRVRASSFTAA
jgi:hypothetical protein